MEPAPRDDELEPAELDPAEVVVESLRVLRQEQHERERRKLEREGDIAVAPAAPRPSMYVRVFGSESFFRLWLAQAITSLGDWLGFSAIIVLATRIGAGSGGAAVGVVMAARIIPGFFFAAGAGVLIDRMDRKQVMVVTMIARAAVVAVLPFVDTVLGLVFASLVLEIGTLFFTPAKEASVPNLVPAAHLTTANSLSLAAAYGTFPVASLLFLLLAKVAEWLARFSILDNLRVSQESVAFYVEVACFLVAALMISRLPISREHMRRHEESDESIDLGQVFTEIKEGWAFTFLNPVVRSVNVGLACGLIGGGMVVPLGAEFADKVLGAGTAGFGAFTTALGVGVALGVVTVSMLQKRIPKERVFALSVLVAGVWLFSAATTSTFALAALFVGLMGLCAGSVYVLGFTLLHENVGDELRGRVFAGLYTLVRLCVLLAFAAGPFLSGALDSLSESLFDGDVEMAGVTIQIPGVRLTLWLAGAIMVVAGILSWVSLRSTRAATKPVDGAVDGAC